jgi:hypothetical protein
MPLIIIGNLSNTSFVSDHNLFNCRFFALLYLKIKLDIRVIIFERIKRISSAQKYEGLPRINFSIPNLLHVLFGRRCCYFLATTTIDNVQS